MGASKSNAAIMLYLNHAALVIFSGFLLDIFFTCYLFRAKSYNIFLYLLIIIIYKWTKTTYTLTLKLAYLLAQKTA